MFLILLWLENEFLNIVESTDQAKEDFQKALLALPNDFFDEFDFRPGGSSPLAKKVGETYVVIIQNPRPSAGIDGSPSIKIPEGAKYTRSISPTPLTYFGGFSFELDGRKYKIGYEFTGEIREAAERQNFKSSLERFLSQLV